MGTAGRSAPLRRAGSLLGLLGLELGAVLALHWLGRFPGLRIRWDQPVPWVLSSPVQEVLGAVLRTVGLVMAYWLLASTVLYLLASLTRLPSAVRAVGWATLPLARRVADHAVAVTLATSMVGGTTLGVAGPALAADRGGGTGPPARKPVAAAQATTTTYGFEPAGPDAADQDTGPPAGTTRRPPKRRPRPPKRRPPPRPNSGSDHRAAPGPRVDHDHHGATTTKAPRPPSHRPRPRPRPRPPSRPPPRPPPPALAGPRRRRTSSRAPVGDTAFDDRGADLQRGHDDLDRRAAPARLRAHPAARPGAREAPGDAGSGGGGDQGGGSSGGGGPVERSPRHRSGTGLPGPARRQPLDDRPGPPGGAPAAAARASRPTARWPSTGQRSWRPTATGCARAIPT